MDDLSELGFSADDIKAFKGAAKAESIKHPVLDNTRTGSALKKYDGQHGFNDIVDNYVQYSKEFDIVGGDGDQILLPQGWSSEWIKEIREVPSR